MQIPPRTHYLRREGPSLAYQVFGEGPPLVMAPSVPSHLDLMWVDPGYTQVLRLARRAPRSKSRETTDAARPLPRILSSMESASRDGAMSLLAPRSGP
jgi:hypothetical protein